MSRNIKLNIPQNLGLNFSKHSCLPTGRDELKIFGFQYIRPGSEISILYAYKNRGYLQELKERIGSKS